MVDDQLSDNTPPWVAAKLAESHDGARFAAGLKARREVLGDAYVGRALSADAEMSQEFQTYVTEHCWGVAWDDERLSRRERSLATLAITAALGRLDEFALHVRGAFNNGLTRDELSALTVHIGVYAGVPAAVSCQRILLEIFAELDAQNGAERPET